MPTTEEKVRLCRGLAVVPFEEGLIVEGAAHRHVFRGRAASQVLPRLFALLDGSREASTLCAETGLTRGQLDQALDLLDGRGLLETAEPRSTHAAPSEQTVLYLSRTLGASGGYRSTAELLDTLADGAVVVLGPQAIAEALVVDLVDSGVGSVLTALPTLAGPSAGSPTRSVARTVVVVVESTDEPDFARSETALDDAIAWSALSGAPVLRVAASPQHVEIGPTFFAGMTACPACLRRSRTEAGWEQTGPGSGEPPTMLAAGLAAHQVVSIVGRLPTMSDSRVVSRFAIDSMTTQRYWVAPYDDCPACGVSLQPADETAQAARPRSGDFFESTVASLPATLAPRLDVPRAENEKLGRLMTQRPDFPTHPRRPLSPSLRVPRGLFGEAPVADPTAPSGCLDEELLGEVMRRVAGLRSEPASGNLQRWVPSGGSLASVELYLIVETGLLGLPGTIFRYSDLTHEAIAVRPEAIPLSHVLAGTGLEDESFTAALVMVAADTRLASKYAEFSYRLAHLDAGCASTQLAAVAGGYGLDLAFAARWDERLADTLGLAREEQYVTAVAGLRSAPRSEGDMPCR
ncbi:hypothetical protein [Streptacidiphilus anmyonensis]|uniref:hypothetical protein n=1 Tax=Streptacidiphilus anmyonensis TaxID=405782 RepID=UPI001364918B|nr:hypothetical protein [Streptacidiphilus anmyonensis]